MLFCRTVVVALAAGSLLSPLAASAASVTAILYGANDTRAAVSPGAHVINVDFNGQTENGAYVGQINRHDATSTDYHAGLNGRLATILGPNATFATYSIDGEQSVQFGSRKTSDFGVEQLDTSSRPGDGMGSATAGESTESGKAFHDLTNAGFNGFDGLGFNRSGTDSFTGNGSDGSDGSIAIATQWLGDVGTKKPYDSKYPLYTVSAMAIQDQVSEVPSTPLPAALPAGLLLLSSLAFARRARRQPA